MRLSLTCGNISYSLSFKLVSPGMSESPTGDIEVEIIKSNLSEKAKQEDHGDGGHGGHDDHDEEVRLLNKWTSEYWKIWPLTLHICTCVHIFTNRKPAFYKHG